MNIEENIINQVGKIKIAAGQFSCDYCNKSFQREKTLIVHVCKERKRWHDKNNKDVMIAFNSYDLFYKMEMRKPQEYENFVKSKLYSSFIKYGNYCIDTKIIDQVAYTKWLIVNKIKLHKWNNDSNYGEFIKEYIKKEPLNNALKRFVKCAAETDYFDDFWEKANGDLITCWVESGKISPWILLCSKRAGDAIRKLPEDNFNRIVSCIDIDFWDRKKQANPEDSKFVSDIIDGY